MSTEELLRRLSCMEQRVRTLEGQKAVVPAVTVAPTSMAPPGQQVGPQPVVGARVPHQSTPPVAFEPGKHTGFAYQCQWQNPTNETVGYGESANAEMCFLWHYYYPSQGFQVCFEGACVVK